MNLATIQAIFSALEAITSFLIKNGPALLADGEAIIADLKLAWASATSGTAITADQQTQIDTALGNANTTLSAAVAAQQAQS